jgi:hypothetical protein
MHTGFLHQGNEGNEEEFCFTPIRIAGRRFMRKRQGAGFLHQANEGNEEEFCFTLIWIAER